MVSYMKMKCRLASKRGSDSEWQRMVNAKAVEIVNNLERRHVNVSSYEELYKAMLNGARTYQEYSNRYSDIHQTPELAKMAMDRVASIAF